MSQTYIAFQIVPLFLPEPSLDIHESDDDTGVSIPFTVNFDDADDLTVPGIPLGEGQQVNLPTDETTFEISISFDLTSDQWIHLSEVCTFYRACRLE